jgi:pantoate kinase
LRPDLVASAVAFALKRMSGRIGPKFAQLDTRLLMVRNHDFFDQLARELGDLPIYDQYKSPDVSNEFRESREVAEAASLIVDAYTVLCRTSPTRTTVFKMMIAGKTKRIIVRELKERSSQSIADDLVFCADAIILTAGEDVVNRLLAKKYS